MTYRIVVLLIVMAVLVACDGENERSAVPHSVTAEATAVPVTPSVETTSELEGTAWQLATLDGRSPENNSRITLTFEEGIAGGFAGCNSYGGDYTATAVGGLIIPEFSYTLAFCTEPPNLMPQESAYLDQLGHVTGFALLDDRLELLGHDGAQLLVFVPQERFAMNPAELVSGAWRLVDWSDRALLPDTALTLIFDSAVTMSGFAGCRHYEGSYAAEGDSIRFPTLAMVETDCPLSEDYLIQEGDFTTALGQTAQYRLQSDRLDLFTEPGVNLVFARLPDAAAAESIAGTATPTPTPTTMPTPSPVPTSADIAGWLSYTNTFYDYSFSYPPEATISVEGVSGFPTEELPENMTPTQYRQYLEDTLPDDICVGLRYRTGFVVFQPGYEAGGKYAGPCGITGVGDYDLEAITETLTIDGQPYSAAGWRVTERNDEATWHNQFYKVSLGEAFSIDYGSAAGSEKAFLEIKPVLEQIVMSFSSAVTRAGLACGRPEDLVMTGLEIVTDPVPCLVWEDITNDESGFIIELSYAPTGESFRVELAADSNQWLLPPHAVPQPGDAAEPCRRQEYRVDITAIRTSDSGNLLFASQQGVIPCYRLESP